MTTSTPTARLADTTITVAPSCQVEFGAGIIHRLPDAIAALGQHRAFVITDRGLRAAGVLDRVLHVLTDAGLEHGVYDGVLPNPSTATVDEGATRARRFGPAAIVALGGGSAMDAAKGIALLAANTGTAEEFDYRDEPAHPGLPIVAIPTTAGTGAETNGFGVIEDTTRRCKVYIGHDTVRPRIAMLDPELTVGVPAPVTAATGIDALVHGIESLSSRGANPISIGYARQAVRMVSAWLPSAVEDGTDLEARAQLILGAHLAGQALTISGLGLVHGIAHALTAHTGTPHGVALAAVLRPVMEFNREAARASYVLVAEAMRAQDAITAVDDLVERVGVRHPLRELGCVRNMLPDIAAAAIADAVTANSPRIPVRDDVLEILQATF
ncbi:MAG TPA: iron-containing alcohol dehydrogenase [Pseudonocardiaceae bacterium]|jgi:alcohol dehydrogenase|nr:iron-containing alcohol dehydrogenase [Pseudonocardiaceae bacterium]